MLDPVFFRTALQCSGGYHLERGGMPLYDAVEINCRNGITVQKIKVQISSVWAKGCVSMIVCVI